MYVKNLFADPIKAVLPVYSLNQLQSTNRDLLRYLAGLSCADILRQISACGFNLLKYVKYFTQNKLMSVKLNQAMC